VSSHVEDTPRKRDRRSSPEQMNSNSGEPPGGSYSPTVLCVQAMGWEALCAASCCVLSPNRVKSRRGNILDFSGLSQSPVQEPRHILQFPQVQVYLYTIIYKRKPYTQICCILDYLNACVLHTLAWPNCINLSKYTKLLC
jgi:hypothetical protein